jgi:hypothetical protein
MKNRNLACIWTLAMTLSWHGVAAANLHQSGSDSDEHNTSSPKAATTDTGAKCIEGPSQPAAFPTLRPHRTAICSYDFDQLVARILLLSINTSQPDSVENVERAFDLPQMTTSYDSPRIASYSMILSGRDGWRLRLDVREGFYPTDKGPTAFEPGLRPKRLYSVEKAKLWVGMIMLEASPGPAPVQCLPVTPLITAIRGAGWQEVDNQSLLPPDGGPISSAFDYGNKRVAIKRSEGPCAEAIFLMQGKRR